MRRQLTKAMFQWFRSTPDLARHRQATGQETQACRKETTTRPKSIWMPTHGADTLAGKWSRCALDISQPPFTKLVMLTQCSCKSPEGRILPKRMSNIPPAVPDRRWPHAVFLVLAFAFLLAIPVLLRPNEFVRDDAYFYLQVAFNIVQGHGSTFHGITPTNGYHPMWMAGVVASVFLAGGERVPSLHALVALQVLLSFTTALLFLKLARHLGLGYGIVGAAVLLSYLFGTGVFGSEAHLNALMMVASMLVLWLALNNDRTSLWFATGLLFGLAILARLDNVFIVTTLCGLGVLHHARGPGDIARRAAAGLLGGMLVLIPYLAHNFVTYGHFTPISGAIKSSFPEFALDLSRLGPVGRLAVPFGLVNLLVGLGLDGNPRRRVVWLGIGAGVLAHATYVIGFTDHYTFWPWYYVGGVLAAALFAAWLPGRFASLLGPSRSVAYMGPLVLLLTLAVLAAGAGRAWLKAYAPFQLGPLTVNIQINEYRWPEEFGRWMKDNLPSDSRVFVYDWPGAIAWYSELSILAMDGLVNDFHYNDELLALGVEGYLCAHRVQYYFGLHESDGPVERVAVTAPLYRKDAGVLSLHERDLVVRVRDVVRRPALTLPFAIWRLHCPPEAGKMDVRAGSASGLRSPTTLSSSNGGVPPLLPLSSLQNRLRQATLPFSIQPRTPALDISRELIGDSPANSGQSRVVGTGNPAERRPAGGAFR